MRSIFFLSVLLFGIIGLRAQEFNGGLRIGIAGSQVNGDKLTGFDKLGIIAGAYVSRKFSDKISLQMEMVYIQKGSRRPTDDNNTFYLMKVNYLEVPLLFQYFTSKKLALYAGPSFGTLIFSEESYELGVYNNNPPFEKFELAGNGGILYNLSDHWTFDGRYSHSITTIRPYPGGAPTTYFDQGQYNVLIEFTFLYKF